MESYNAVSILADSSTSNNVAGMHTHPADSSTGQSYDDGLLVPERFRQGLVSITDRDHDGFLDPDYKVRKQPSKFFKIGKVFLTLWSEPAAAGPYAESSLKPGTLAGRYNERVFSKIRRFVVIRESQSYCTCLQILSYGGRGVMKRNIAQDEHAIVYTSRTIPTLPGEGHSSSLQEPIRIDPDEPGNKLDPGSLIHFGKCYTVEHNVKVKSFGTVNQLAMSSLLKNFRAIWYGTPEQQVRQQIAGNLVPFARDAQFVQRPGLTQMIRAKLGVSSARVALVGLGGVGKSQLAIEYAYELRHSSPETWVFWISASSKSSFESSVYDILAHVGASKRRMSHMDALLMLRDWLLDPRNGKWLVILDNADDTTNLDIDLSDHIMASSRRLKTYLDSIPCISHGATLITTRSRHAASKLVEDDSVVSVGPMNDQEGQMLIANRLGSDQDPRAVQELAEALDHMPLAIAQATAYIKAGAPRRSIDQYLQKLKEVESRLRILDREQPDLRRHSEAINSITRTWQISFEHIRVIRPSATDLLSLMSFFDHRTIPEALLRTRDLGQRRDQNMSNTGYMDATATAAIDLELDGAESHDPCDSKSVDEHDDEEEFEKDVEVLLDYSFMWSTTDHSCFEMHPLVQLSTQAWLRAQSVFERWLHQSIVNLAEAFPLDPAFENWSTCAPFYNHAVQAARLTPERKEAKLALASLMYRSACYAVQRGYILDADRMAAVSVKIRETCLGAVHEQTLDSIDLLARVKSDLGLWNEAKKLQSLVLSRRQQILGVDHLHTFSSYHNLARTYQNLGMLVEAEQIIEKALDAQTVILGRRHPRVLESMDLLASLYSDLGRFEQAEELQLRVVALRTRTLGTEHVDTLTAMSNLATIYMDQGKYSEAEELQQRLLETSKRVLGEEHPMTLERATNLAKNYHSQKRWEDSEALIDSVLEVSSRVLGAEHPSTLAAMRSLAATYLEQDKSREAESLQELVAKTATMALGDQHPITLASVAELATLHRMQARMKERDELAVKP